MSYESKLKFWMIVPISTFYSLLQTTYWILKIEWSKSIKRLQVRMRVQLPLIPVKSVSFPTKGEINAITNLKFAPKQFNTQWIRNKFWLPFRPSVRYYASCHRGQADRKEACARMHAGWLGCGSTHAIHIGKMSSQVRGELSRCGSSVTYFDGLESFTRSDKLFSGLTKVLLMQTQNVLQKLSTR